MTSRKLNEWEHRTIDFPKSRLSVTAIRRERDISYIEILNGSYLAIMDKADAVRLRNALNKLIPLI